ncbi:MAG TPA: 1-(5-phosphoribosyl)-5-[(5-phosphoribosylamino)methylideneamino]imidazole-4-carboxamide isomerase [Candidatus Scatomorpha merdavium]|nr:1-(5-phosphoribosyl)-5-[(5-phosphoribosylamino)methylideneamino]imidazole-4-carboxamide isomerase [Candidatus Scatomorpha merdavium]
MLIFPAIDLYEGRAVRLYKGDYAKMTVYSEDPAAVARDFAAQGVRQMHTVDLEGARDGGTPNLGIIERIAKETGLFVECGGGLRDMAAIDRAFAAGVGRVILGTAAVSDERLLAESVQKYGEKIAVGADLRDGRVAIKGWREDSGLTAEDFLRKVEALGVRTVICTDISRDGAMRGANAELYERLQREFGLELIASGGVSSLEDVARLRALGLYGAIIGKAYYTGDISLREAVEAAR